MLSDARVPGAQAIVEQLSNEEQALIQELLNEACDGDHDGQPPAIVATSAVLSAHAGVVHKWLARALARIEQLEGRLAEVETRGVKFLGVYQRAQSYDRGAIVHYSGSAYVAIRTVPVGEPPNGVGGFWQIFAQRGRDASSRDRRGEG